MGVLMVVYGGSDSGRFSERLGPRRTEPGNFNLRMYEKQNKNKQWPDKANICCGGTNRRGHQRGHMFTWI